MAERARAFDAPLADYEHDAQALLRALHAGDRDAVSRFKWEHPRYREKPLSAVEPGTLGLADAKLVIAHEHYFESWDALAAFAGEVRRDGPARRF
jgi:hypothetical protein